MKSSQSSPPRTPDRAEPEPEPEPSYHYEQPPPVIWAREGTWRTEDAGPPRPVLGSPSPSMYSVHSRNSCQAQWAAPHGTYGAAPHGAYGATPHGAAPHGNEVSSPCSPQHMWAAQSPQHEREAYEAYSAGREFSVYDDSYEPGH